MKPHGKSTWSLTAICLAALGLCWEMEGAGGAYVLVIYYFLFFLCVCVWGCLGTPKVVHKPHRGEFSIPHSRPCCTPCTLTMGWGAVSGEEGRSWLCPGPAEGTLGTLPLPWPFSHLQWRLLSSSLLSPLFPSAPRGSIIASLLTCCPICLLFLPLLRSVCPLTSLRLSPLLLPPPP